MASPHLRRPKMQVGLNIREFKQQRRLRQRKRHLKLNIWEMLTILQLLLLAIIARVFSRDVTAAILVSSTNPPGIELYSYANVFFCFGGKTWSLIT